MTRVGRILEIVRYPVKSMAGIPTASAFLGWYGISGDRRFAFRRVGDLSGMPWLTASRFPGLLLYRPDGIDESSGEPIPTHVRSPAGAMLELGSEELNAEITKRCGSEVELMRLRHGIFDEASVSVICLPTIARIGREAGLDLDRRRFRSNILVDTEQREPFPEDAWVGHTLVMGDIHSGPAVSVTTCDERCAMINLDPETSVQDARVLKAAVRLNKNRAGVYATVVRTGTIRVGDPVYLRSEVAIGA